MTVHSSMWIRALAAAAVWCLPAAAGARELVDACGASSSYDLTLAGDALVFDRAAPAPRRITIEGATLAVDGARVEGDAAQAATLRRFEQVLRAQVPRVRALGRRAVDLALEGVREEAAALGVSATTRSELERRLGAHRAELLERIATSNSTKDWQGDAAEAWATDIAGDIVPLLAADIGQQAISAALEGDLEAAAGLRDRAASLADDPAAPLRRRMQGLEPAVRALCPAIGELARLQRDLRDDRGRPLQLLETAPR
jgi:hypothetical protein